MSTRKRVIIADDHSIMRDGLQEVLERSGEYEVVGQARDGEEAVAVAKRLKPDVVIMDLIMPVKDGVDACREIVQSLPETRVLVLTASTDEDVVVDAVAAGASGYLHKFSGKETLLETIRDVVAGEFRIPGEVVRKVFAGMRSDPEQAVATEDQLTARERQILKLFAEGRSYAEIGEAVGIPATTVSSRLHHARAKLRHQLKEYL